jgi:hypothetical protein
MMTVVVGRGNRRAVGLVPDRKDRSIGAAQDREALKNFITRPQLFAAMRKGN